MAMFAPKSAYVTPKKKHINKIALIDADKYKHLVAYDVANDLKNNNPRSNHRLEFFIEERIAEIFNMFSADGYLFCFSGKSYNTFRAHVAFDREYKGNRKDDPSYYEGKVEDMTKFVQVVQERYPTLLFSNLEADDLLCFLQDDDTFIVSNDKDLKQIPGLHYDFHTRDVVKISEEEAFRSLCYQMIVGDSTDCIAGLKGYGPKKAKKIIDETPIKNVLNKVLVEYQMVYGITNGIDAFTETWNLVKLRPKRGDHFLEKHAEAFQLLEAIKQSKNL